MYGKRKKVNRENTIFYFLNPSVLPRDSERCARKLFYRSLFRFSHFLESNRCPDSPGQTPFVNRCTIYYDPFNPDVRFRISRKLAWYRVQNRQLTMSFSLNSMDVTYTCSSNVSNERIVGRSNHSGSRICSSLTRGHTVRFRRILVYHTYIVE